MTLLDFENSVIAQESVLSTDLPTNTGDSASIMEYQVVTVISASHFYVRLKRSKNHLGKVIRDFAKSYIRLGMKLALQDENELEKIPLNDLQKLARYELMLVREKEEYSKQHERVESVFYIFEHKILYVYISLQY